jgi:phospholipid transport system substrate-binding protein
MTTLQSRPGWRYWWLACMALCGVAVSTEPPTAVVRAAIDAVLTTLSSSTLDPSTKRQQAEAIIQARFDFDGMTRRVLATHWDDANANQRAQISDLFRTRLTNAYWQKLAAYQGEHVEYLSEQLRGPTLASVATVIKSVRADVPVDYKLEQHNGHWVVYDVVIEQMSLVRNYRQRFNEIVRRKGIDGLIADLQEQESAAPAAASEP